MYYQTTLKSKWLGQASGEEQFYTVRPSLVGEDQQSVTLSAAALP